MASYQKDRAWSDITIPHIRKIVGPLLLEPAPFELDAKQATDLLVFKARDMRIAARVRRPGYADKYPYEFTIRAHRDNGVETELSKIINGFGDWLFYGHANEANEICRWMVIDLNVFRSNLIKSGRQKLAGGDVFRLTVNAKDNGDGTKFNAYDVRTFLPAPPIIVASSHEIPKPAPTPIDMVAA